MRWALTTRASWSISKRSSTSTAAFIVDQSLAEPITTPTRADVVMPRSQPRRPLAHRADPQHDPFALDRRRVVVAEVAARQRVDVAAGLRAAQLAGDLAADLGVAVRVGGVPDRHGDLGVLLDR